MGRKFKTRLTGILLIALISTFYFTYAVSGGNSEGKIEWYKDIEQAKKEAQGSGRLMFLFFHHPMCGGCKKIISDTLPDKHVKKTIEGEFTPLTYLVTEHEDLARQYDVNWTPTFILADDKGLEQYRWVGYLPPYDFLAQTALSQGHVAFKRGDFNKAQACFKKVLDGYSESEFAPEARYYLGVSQYKATHDPSHLKKAREDMEKLFPENSWTKKASPWGNP